MATVSHRFVRIRYQFISAACIVALVPLRSISAQDTKQKVEQAAKEQGTPQALLHTLQAAVSPKQRSTAARKLVASGPEAVPLILLSLSRDRSSTDTERRAVLEQISAEVPDAQGRFRTPRRRTKKQQQQADKLDWLPKLIQLPQQPGLTDVVVDVVSIRTLAASQTLPGADAILDFAFSSVGIVYRDECGRYLRKMTPYSIPTLIRATSSKKKDSRWRYATYQLERLDRQSADKALHASRINDSLAIAMLEAFRDTRYRDAIGTVLATTNDVSPAIRTAARNAWFAYVTGPPPPDPPKRFLKQAGGQLSDKKVPLWLNYRQLAEIELNKKITEALGSEATLASSLEERSKRLFQHYDKTRASKVLALESLAEQATQAGDHASAVSYYARLLAQNPQSPKREQIAQAYVAYAKQKESQENWHEAATLFAKAHAVFPDGSQAAEILASYEKNLARMLPTPVQEVPQVKPPPPIRSKRWMLIAAIGGGICAMLLLVLGIRRQRSEQL